MSNKQNAFLASIIFTLSFAILILAFTQSANAECVQGSCDNGYGVYIYEDGWIYEGIWKNESFDGMGALTFQNGIKYTGEFKKGLIHGYGRLTLRDGKQQKYTFSNGRIENNDSIRHLWETETKSPVEKHIFYYNIGNAYKKYGNYRKSIQYYNKSLKVNPDFNEAVKNRTHAKKQLAQQSENKPTEIILRGTPGIEPGTHSRGWIEQEKKIAGISSTERKISANGPKNIPVKRQQNSSGTAFFINNNGQLVTNHHVIKDCKTIRIYNRKFDSEAYVINVDDLHDLAIIKSKKSYLKYARLRGGKGSRLGEDIITLGYPLGALLGDTIKVTTGSISSVTGMANNKSMMQISAPIQPGSSGGPVLDMSGNVVGIVVSSLNNLKVAKKTGSLPQNLNFAIKSLTLQKFLDTNGINYVVKNFTIKRETADIVEKAKDYTVRVLCYE